MSRVCHPRYESPVGMPADEALETTDIDRREAARRYFLQELMRHFRPEVTGATSFDGARWTGGELPGPVRHVTLDLDGDHGTPDARVVFYPGCQAAAKLHLGERSLTGPFKVTVNRGLAYMACEVANILKDLLTVWDNS